MIVLIIVAMLATVAVQGPGDYQITKPDRVNQMGPNKWQYMIYTVKITYLDGTQDIKECHDLSEVPLDNVKEMKVIRKEDELDETHPPRKSACTKHGIC